jgi:hypothetical protein
VAVREACFGDVPRLAELMAEMCDRSRYVGRVNVVPERAKRTCMTAIKGHGKATCLFVGVRDGKVESFIIGMADWLFGIGDKLAITDTYFYASKRAYKRDTVRLAQAYQGWAKTVPSVIDVRLTALDSLGPWDRNERLYRRLGFSQEGVIYRKDIDDV